MNTCTTVSGAWRSIQAPRSTYDSTHILLGSERSENEPNKEDANKTYASRIARGIVDCGKSAIVVRRRSHYVFFDTGTETAPVYSSARETVVMHLLQSLHFEECTAVPTQLDYFSRPRLLQVQCVVVLSITLLSLLVLCRLCSRVRAYRHVHRAVLYKLTWSSWTQCYAMKWSR